MLENGHEQRKNVLQTTLKKLFNNHYFRRTNPKNQPKLRINLKKQLGKMRLHTGQINNF
jgi:hypothetical protein